jgi:hypothetical protein
MVTIGPIEELSVPTVQPMEEGISTHLNKVWEGVIVEIS